MEYSMEVFLTDDSSMTYRLCRLMTSFDKASAVMPYRSQKAVSRYDLWLVPTDGGRILDRYTGGVQRVREGFRLYLRHRAVTTDDTVKAEGILAAYIKKLSETLEKTEVYSIERGEVRGCATDSSVWEFYIEFTVYSYEVTPFDGVKFYVRYGNEAPVAVGAGCTLFKESRTGELDVRRYFDGCSYVADKTGEKRRIDFEFETSHERCALSPVCLGEERVTVYTVAHTGEAEMALFVLSELSLTADICKGSLVSDGEFMIGTFNAETGEFISTDTEKGGRRYEMYYSY